MSLITSLKMLYLTAMAVLLVVGGVLATTSHVSLPGARGSESYPDPEDRAMAYLYEIGFGAEYSSADQLLHKWAQEVRIKIHGEPTDADLETLGQVVTELNHLLLGIGIGLKLTDQAANLDLYFSPESEFPAIEPSYVPVNLGIFRVWFDEDGAIHRGRVLIASEGTTQRERSHLIREELTQSLGIFKDSWQYPDSIFYEGWTTTSEFGLLDVPAIRLLYSTQLAPGMTRNQFQGVFSGHESNGARGATYGWRPNQRSGE